MKFYGKCGHKETEGIFLIGSNTILGSSQPWQWPSRQPMKWVCAREGEEGGLHIRLVKLDGEISEISYRGNYEITWSSTPSCEGCPYWENEKKRMLGKGN